MGHTEPRGGAIVAGRYRIDKLIARGGMSTVYLAHQTKLDRPVAFKILSPPPAGEDTTAFEQRFRREAQTLAQLDHNNIVVLHDYGEMEDGRYYLAMEYIDGPRLSDLLKDGPLPVQRALQLLIQVCVGLRYAHKRGVVHRDLKPGNLLIRQSDDEMDQVKIVDFGLVKLVESDQSITRAGLILGSPHCMAPEQVKGLHIDHRADIYAMGVLLFRSVTGQYPFHGTNSAATMIAHINQQIPTFYSVAPELEVPPGLEEVVRRCLAKRPEDRFANMRELIDALTPLMDVPPEGIGIRSQTHTMLPGISVQQPRRAGPIAPPAAVALAMFGAVSMLALVVGAVSLIAVGGLLQARWSRTSVPPPAPTVVIAPAPLAPPPAPALEVEDPGLPPVADGAGSEIPAQPERVAGVEPQRPTPRVPRPPPPSGASEQTPAPAPDPVPPHPDPAPISGENPAPETPEGYLGLPEDLIE